MAKTASAIDASMIAKQNRKGNTLGKIRRDKWLYILALPGILYFVIFKYIPMFGIVVAFQNYNPFTGFVKSEWVGLEHFITLFTDPDFPMLFRNTLLISFYNLLFYFPIPIILSLLLNEIRINAFKRVVQTCVYVPHFLSMVVITGITYVLLSSETGAINQILYNLTGQKIEFLTDPRWFRTIIIFQAIWKESGWGTLIFLAALSNVDPTLYEAAIVDGANRWQKLLHIDLPMLIPTAAILLILRIGNLMSIGFEKVYLMQNDMNLSTSEVIATYVYKIGIISAQYSYSAAINMFNTIVNFILLITVNLVLKRVCKQSLW